MTTSQPLGDRGSSTHLSSAPQSRLATAPVAAGLLSWLIIALGFLGLWMLMQERPQFVGEPMRSSMTELVQESPRIVVRKVTDDIAVIKSAQPESSEILFDMRGHRDHRGLRTVLDMSGSVVARHVLTNVFEEPVFILFRCPHPRTGDSSGQSLQAGGLKLNASVPGTQENAKDAWLWSGQVAAHGTVTLEISYQAAALKGVTYRIAAQGGDPVKQIRVEFRRQNLPSMRFECGDGAIPATDEFVAWERSDFLAPDAFSGGIVEGRNLHDSLLQLMEIGPVVCLLFLVAVGAVVGARQSLSAVQMLTISAGYALYFPLVIYLSARFTFAVALVIAVAVPGSLLVNYARLHLGARLGLAGGPLFLVLYQVFPTLAAFAGWNRGMVLLCLGVVTFWVLINLQNQVLKKTIAAAALLLGCWTGERTEAAEVQVILPAQLAEALSETKWRPNPPLLSFEPAAYQIVDEAAYFLVEVKVSFRVLRSGQTPLLLFAQPVHLQSRDLEVSTPEVAQLVTVSNRLALLAERPGPGVLRFSYRVAAEPREGRKRAQFPLLLGPTGKVRIESGRADLEHFTGSLWSKRAQDQRTIYELGVAGEELLIVEWRELEGTGVAKPADGAKDFYGIGITQARHLTVIGSDGSCTHFTELELPASQAEEFRLRLPPQARLISISINGTEVGAPAVEGQLCRLRLPERAAQQIAHRLSFRLAYPPVRLGFVGAMELALPEVFQTVGTLGWVVALPAGFGTQVIASGLEVQKSPPDLTRFGDYGRILKTNGNIHLAKDLAPPGPVNLTLRYRQAVPALDGP